MKNNKPENETTNRQNDDQQAQLADLPVEKAQETDVRGGVDLKASGNTASLSQTFNFTLGMITENDKGAQSP